MKKKNPPNSPAWALVHLVFQGLYLSKKITQLVGGEDLFKRPKKQYPPPKTNMSPENQWLEDVFPIKIVPFKGTC